MLIESTTNIVTGEMTFQHHFQIKRGGLFVMYFMSSLNLFKSRNLSLKVFQNYRKFSSIETRNLQLSHENFATYIALTSVNDLGWVQWRARARERKKPECYLQYDMLVKVACHSTIFSPKISNVIVIRNKQFSSKDKLRRWKRKGLGDRDKDMVNARGWGYSWKFLVGVCRPVLQILTLFQTKKCHFPHPFSGQAFRQKLCHHYLN